MALAEAERVMVMVMNWGARGRARRGYSTPASGSWSISVSFDVFFVGVVIAQVVILLYLSCHYWRKIHRIKQFFVKSEVFFACCICYNCHYYSWLKFVLYHNLPICIFVTRDDCISPTFSFWMHFSNIFILVWNKRVFTAHCVYFYFVKQVKSIYKANSIIWQQFWATLNMRSSTITKHGI